MQWKAKKERHRPSEFQNGLEEGRHDQLRGLAPPGNLKDFPFMFVAGYKEGRKKVLKRQKTVK